MTDEVRLDKRWKIEIFRNVKDKKLRIQFSIITIVDKNGGINENNARMVGLTKIMHTSP